MYIFALSLSLGSQPIQKKERKEKTKQTNIHQLLIQKTPPSLPLALVLTQEEEEETFFIFNYKKTLFTLTLTSLLTETLMK